MWVLVAADTICLLRAMLLAMTSRTERHEFVIVIFTRVVCVKNLVALLAGKSMFTSGSFQIGKLAHMALATLYRLQGSRGHAVKGFVNLWQWTFASRNKPWLEKSSQGDNTGCN